MLIPWNTDDTLFANVASRNRGTRYHLLAERLPGDGWDWTAWRAGDSPDSALHGYALSAKSAMAAARGAVRYWEAAPIRLRVANAACLLPCSGSCSRDRWDDRDPQAAATNGGKIPGQELV